jgi:phage terminase large subunit GpA-like protein
VTGTPSPFASALGVIAGALHAWRPPRRLRLSEWADEHFYLSAESSAEPGRWRSLPYQREPMDCFTDARVEQITFMKSARVGYTKMLNAGIGYHMHHDPCAMLLIQPTLTDAKGYSKEEIAPMLRDCQVISELIPEEVERKNSLLHKRFPGGLLQIVGARSAASFRRVSRRVVLGDEADGYPPSAGLEGDPISLAIRRSEYFWNRKIVIGSTPTLAGSSRIEHLFLSGDQRRYFVPCSQCGHMAPFVFQRAGSGEAGGPAGHLMRWTKGQPETAHFVCQECGGVIEPKDRRAVIERGEWRAAAPFTGHASFHIWAAYSYSPNATWADLVSEYEAAVENRETHKTFVNTALGETWKEDGEAPDWEVLYNRREKYASGTCPTGVLLLTAGVDVQKDRLVYEVVGWGRGRRSWSIDAHVIPGDTSDETEAGPWPKLDALLERTFRHEGGTELRVAMLAIDSGAFTNTVYSWARRFPISRVIAVKGTDRAGVLIGMPSKVDVTIRGRKVGYKVWPVAVGMAKTELYGWLKLRRPTDEARAAGAVDPPGYCHFPEYGEGYFKQLTAERLVLQKDSRGFSTYIWTLPPGAENHALDTRVYARAAAAVVGIDRLTEQEWTDLEKSVGQAPPKKKAAPPTSTTPTTPAVPRSGWIKPTPDWLKKGR